MSGHANGHNGVGPGKFVYPDSPLHELFHQQVARTPDRIAVIDQERELTYTELKRQTQTLALSLRHRGVSEEQPVVPIFMPRCLEFAVGYIAALSAGGAYLPLEVGYPAEMLRRVLAEAKPVLTLTLESQAAKLPADAPRLCLDPGWEEACALLPAELAALPSLATSLESLAYCVYSSGTTGEPKGISCPHRGSVLSYSHRAHHAPYAADGSDREACNVFFVWEMLRPLLQGATLVVVPDSVIYDPPALSSFLERHAVTRMLFTPSLLEAVLDSPALASGDELRRAFAAFRVVVLCGEVATAELRARVLSLAPAGLKLLNLYSISECHDVSMVDLAATPPPEGKYCSTGPLLDGVEVLILEDANQADKSGEAQRGADAAKALRPVPLGLPGEVFVSGPCLARGYLQRPDLTAKKFLPRPPSLSATPAPQTPGQDAASPALYSRLYDTGDWGRLRPDGTLEIFIDS